MNKQLIVAKASRKMEKAFFSRRRVAFPEVAEDVIKFFRGLGYNCCMRQIRRMGIDNKAFVEESQVLRTGN